MDATRELAGYPKLARRLEEARTDPDPSKRAGAVALAERLLELARCPDKEEATRLAGLAIFNECADEGTRAKLLEALRTRAAARP